MQRLRYNGNEIPKRALWAAIWSWALIVLVYVPILIVTPLAAVLVALTARPMERHPLGLPTEGHHSQKYCDKGSSGYWEYWNSPWAILKWWNNYEDGVLGEPTGKHSSAVKGTERSFKSIFLWTIRNPFNWGKRTLPMFHCKINDCRVEFWGAEELSDKEPGKTGEYLCRAIHNTTGKVYYGYRSVEAVGSGLVRQAVYGFKIKPSHGLSLQDGDDLDKAITFRPPVITRID